MLCGQKGRWQRRRDRAGVVTRLNRIGLDVVVMGIVSTGNRCRSAIAYGLDERDVAGVFIGLQGIGVVIGGRVVVGIGGLDAGPIAGLFIGGIIITGESFN